MSKALERSQNTILHELQSSMLWTMLWFHYHNKQRFVVRYQRLITWAIFPTGKVFPVNDLFDNIQSGFTTVQIVDEYSRTNEVRTNSFINGRTYMISTASCLSIVMVESISWNKAKNNALHLLTYILTGNRWKISIHGLNLFKIRKSLLYHQE